MRSAAFRKPATESDSRTRSCASLSVVVVSSRPSVSQQAAAALKAATRDFAAQLIVVSQNDDPAFATKVTHYGAEFVVAPMGSSRAAMCDLGMTRVKGSIVAVRDDVAIGDARWLDAYRAVLPRREAVAATPMESIVMDTLVAGRASLADAPFASIEPRALAGSIEMAAAV